MKDHRFHRRLQLAPGRQRDTPVGVTDGAGLEQIQSLVDNLETLFHLVKTHHKAGVGVADLARRHVEVVVFITAVRLRLAKVERHTRRPQTRPGQTIVERRFFGDQTYAFSPVDEDVVFSEHRGVLLQHLRKVFSKGSRRLFKTVRQVARQPADAEVPVVHPDTANHLEQVHNPLALAHSVKKDRQRAHIQDAGPEKDQMAGDTVELI